MSTREEFVKKLAEQEAKLRAAKKLLGPRDERQAQRELMSRKRAAARDIEIPLPEDVKRRKKSLRDLFFFLTTYFPDVFAQPFTPDRKAMAEAIMHAATYSGDYANAGPRGEGKTRIALYTSLWLMLSGRAVFPLIVSKNQQRANSELSSLKDQFEHNDKFMADFPEVCAPIRALEGWASRARMQTVNGFSTRISWGADHIILPTVPKEALPASWPKGVKSTARGQVLCSVGIEGPIRGLSYRDKRPDLAILDDIDDRESASSEAQTATRVKIIEQDIAGLAGPGQRISRVMLCTVINRHCIAWQYTDRKLKPSWRGQRFRAIVHLPDREDLWEEVVDLKRNRKDEDPDARESHNKYLANKEAMDTGYVVANPFNFTPTTMPDGSELESSAQEHYYNLVADIGWDNFATEYQNDPPSEEESETNDLTSAMIGSRLSGYEHREVPRDIDALNIGIDVSKFCLHFTTIAWRRQAIGYVVEHGTTTVRGDTSDAQIEKSILAALWDWRDRIQQYPYTTEGGEIIEPKLVLIDSGSGMHTQAVYEFCKRAGDMYQPSKGKGSDYRQGEPSAKRRVGEYWYKHWQPEDRVWLHIVGTDYWKRWAQERFKAPPLLDNGSARPGSLSLYELPTDDGKPLKQYAKDRREFTHHMVSEMWVRKVVPGKPIKEGMTPPRGANHWLDSTALSCAAGSMCGIRLLGEVHKRTPPNERPSLAQLAKGR